MEINWKEQCKYCTKGFNTTYCDRYKSIIKNSSIEWECPYFIFDTYINK